jgi:hypothetical protein
MIRRFPVMKKSPPPKAAASGAMSMAMKPVAYYANYEIVPLPKIARNGNNPAILNFPVRTL